jgi:UDP-N-acetyl-D-galactosamine dehydrogenase
MVTNQSYKYKIAIIGLGYVGLPLLVEFSKYFKAIGYDINKKRVNELSNGFDSTQEIDDSEMLESINFTSDVLDITDCNFYIITVPTPVKANNLPNEKPIKDASKLIGAILKPNDTVIYESTVYPGMTEEVCIPILERNSGLVFNKDFSCGYSPERINPSDKVHTLTQITKIISASNEKSLSDLHFLYGTIIKAGLYEAESIKVAEAAKVIENAQRDINIAFMNELAIIFKKLDIPTQSVLDAAATKWNFLPFSPGMVGGHCIGVDPYYLSFKAKEAGYTPQIILSGRKLNDSMSTFIGEDVINEMNKKNIKIKNARILVMGVTFKENCPDTRNSKSFNLISFFKSSGMKVDAYDPFADPATVLDDYNIKILNDPKLINFNHYQGIIFTVAHDEFRNLNLALNESRVIYDVKSFLKVSDATI